MNTGSSNHPNVWGSPSVLNEIIKLGRYQKRLVDELEFLVRARRQHDAATQLATSMQPMSAPPHAGTRHMPQVSHGSQASVDYGISNAIQIQHVEYVEACLRVQRQQPGTPQSPVSHNDRLQLPRPKRQPKASAASTAAASTAVATTVAPTMAPTSAPTVAPSFYV